jgi:hypothetical protein
MRSERAIGSTRSLGAVGTIFRSNTASPLPRLVLANRKGIFSSIDAHYKKHLHNTPGHRVVHNTSALHVTAAWLRLYLSTNPFEPEDGGIRDGGLLMGMSAVMFAIVLPFSLAFIILALHLSAPD